MSKQDFYDIFKRASERNKVKYAVFEKSYCQEFEDGMDGFVIHAPTCHRYQDMAISGTGCIQLTRVRYWPTGLSKVR